MNKKKLCKIIALLSGVFSLKAEQTVYYVNPNASSSLSIMRDANIKDNKYEYSIENEYGRTIRAAAEASPSFDSVREFIAREEDYSKKDRILMEWDFKEDDGASVLDGSYTLRLKETSRKTPAKIIPHTYTVHLDSEPPNIFPRLSRTNVFRNRREEISVFMDSEHSEKANLWRVLLDDSRILYESDLSENEMIPFPVGIGLSYDEYKKLSPGPHEIKIIARDCAGNTTEKSLLFELGEYPLNLSVFSASEGIAYRKDGTSSEFRYIGTGISGCSWKTLIKDRNDNVHFSRDYEEAFDVTCPLFSWNGISEATGQPVPEGSYTAEVVCRDLAGNELSGTAVFVVAAERNFAMLEHGKNRGGPFLSGMYEGDVFKLSLANYAEPFPSAVLNVSQNGKLIFEKAVNDISDIAWDGLDSEGNMALSTGETYNFSLSVSGGKYAGQTFENSIRSGLVCGNEDSKKTRRRILAESVYFTANESVIFTDNEFFIRNSTALRKIATALLLQMSDEDVIILEGNANYTSYPNKAHMKKEQPQLVSLSRKRAEIVKRILVFYGLSEEKIRVEANGGDNYIAPPNSGENWKNRRVEFFIEKTEKKGVPE